MNVYISFTVRIINMSSGFGKIFHVGPERQKEVLDPDLTVEKLSNLMDEFVRYSAYILIRQHALTSPNQRPFWKQLPIQNVLDTMAKQHMGPLHFPEFPLDLLKGPTSTVFFNTCQIAPPPSHHHMIAPPKNNFYLEFLLI